MQKLPSIPQPQDFPSGQTIDSCPKPHAGTKPTSLARRAPENTFEDHVEALEQQEENVKYWLRIKEETTQRVNTAIEELPKLEKAYKDWREGRAPDTQSKVPYSISGSDLTNNASDRISYAQIRALEEQIENDKDMVENIDRKLEEHGKMIEQERCYFKGVEFGV